MSLLVISTHPIQYQAPVYRALQQQFHIPTTVIYGSDFSIAGYRDREFDTKFSWDTDLLNGYTSFFLSRTDQGGAQSYETVSTKGLTALLNKLDFKAALVLGYQLRFHLEAAWALHNKRVPLLLRAEASDRSVQRSRPKQAVRDFFLRIFYQQFARILYIGAESYAHYRRLGTPDKKLIFSPYCVDTSVFDPSLAAQVVNRTTIRTEFQLPPNQIVLLFSGKLVPRKAPNRLLEALRTLPEDQRRRFTLMFLGDGELRVELEHTLEQDPIIDARFLGFKNQTELSRYYQAADMLILPSLSGETWGLVVNEALYHGLPCVVSDRVGCAPDLIQTGITGEVFMAESPNSLADAIQRCAALLENPNTATACQTLVRRYSVAAAAQGIAQAYAAVL